MFFYQHSRCGIWDACVEPPRRLQRSAGRLSEQTERPLRMEVSNNTCDLYSHVWPPSSLMHKHTPVGRIRPRRKGFSTGVRNKQFGLEWGNYHSLCLMEQIIRIAHITNVDLIVNQWALFMMIIHYCKKVSLHWQKHNRTKGWYCDEGINPYAITVAVLHLI